MKFRKSGGLLTVLGVMFALCGFAGTAIAASPVAAVDRVAAMNVSAMALTVAVAVLLLAIVTEVWRATASDRPEPVRARPRRTLAALR